VRIIVNLQNVEQCVITDYDNSNNDLVDIINLDNISLYIDYVFLDQDERRKFAQSVHEYLIEQIQFDLFTSFVNQDVTCQLDFVRPCKEIVFVAQREFVVNPLDLSTDPAWQNYTVNPVPYITDTAQSGSLISITLSTASSNTNNFYATFYVQITSGTGAGQLTQIISYDGTSKIANVAGWTIAPDYTSNYSLFQTYPLENPISTALLTLNGEDRASIQPGMYFNYVQPWEAHSDTPSNGINVYSFGLHAEELQPSGTCNLGRINDIKLQLSMTDDFMTTLDSNTFEVKVFAQNYNILRVMGGLAGPAFSI